MKRLVIALTVVLLASCKPKGEPPVEEQYGGPRVLPAEPPSVIRYDLRDLLAEHERSRAPRGPIAIEVIYDGKLDPLLKAGFKLSDFVEGAAGGHLMAAEIRALAMRPEVREIRLSGQSHLM